MFERLKYKARQILSRISQFLKTDMMYVVKQGSWLFGGEIINNILSLGLIIAFANLLPVSTYGTYKYILSIYGIFALFGLSGAGPSIIKSVAEGSENIFKPALKTQIKWGFLGSLCLIAAAFYYLLNGNEVFGYSFFIAAAALPFFESLNTYQHILAGKKRFDLQTKYYSGTRITSTLSMIVALFLSDNLFVILLSYFLPYIVANLILGYLALQKIELNDKFDPRAITYMKHLSFINAISFSVSYLEGVFIFQLLGPIQLAIYSIASAPVSRVQSFFSIIPELSLPKYTERPIEEIKSIIFSKIFKSMVICTSIVLIYAAIVPFFFKWFLPQYEDSIFYAQLLAIPLIWYPFALLSRVFLAKGATKFIYQNTVIGSALRLVIMFLGIYFYGLIGAVASTILFSILSYIILYYFFRKL